MILVIFFISILSAHSNTETFYRIDESHTIVRLAGEAIQKVTGTVDFLQDFEKSQFNFSSSKAIKFVSQSIEGIPQAFKLRGLLTINDITREVEFATKYVGPQDYRNDHEKILFQGKVSINPQDFDLDEKEDSIDIKFHLLAERPSQKTSTLVKKVNSLIE